MNKRPKIDIQQPHLLSDAVYAALLKANNKNFPQCKYALAHFAQEDCKTSTSFAINRLDDFLGFWKTLHEKNFNRFVKSVKQFAESHEIENDLLNIYRDARQLRMHQQGKALLQNTPCSICFPVTSVPPSIHERCVVALSSFVQQEHNNGANWIEIYETINKCSFELLSLQDSSLECYKTSLERTKLEFIEYKYELTNNIEKFKKHLESVSADLHYGCGLSSEQVEDLDHLLLCRPFTKQTVECHVLKLPNIKTILVVGVNDASLRDQCFNRLFNEYCNFVLTNNKEPIFLELGKKYKLCGPNKGHGNSSLSNYAQSVCLNMLLEPVHYGVFNEIRKILDIHGNFRSHYKPHPLVKDINIPRLPKKSVADLAVQNLRDSKEILLGELMPPTVLEAWDVIEGKSKSLTTQVRKIDFLSIRQSTLEFQESKNYLRAQPREYYHNLNLAEVKETLSKYGLYNLGIQYTDTHLRNLLHKAETTRHFAIWYDHAILLNRSYILFIIYPIYSDSVYCCKELTQRDLQKIIERPYIHAVGISPSTTASEESFHSFRCEQAKSLSISLRTSSGIVITDKLKFVIGDAPVRGVETGQNKSGPYRLPTLSRRFPLDNLGYAEFINLKHQNFEEQTKHANKGGFFTKSENHGKSLQDAMKESPLELIKIRSPHLRVDGKTKQELKEILYDDLAGRRRPPIYFMKNPDDSAKKLCVDGVEVVPVEPLHDLKGVTVKAFELIPGPQTEGVLKVISSIISNSTNLDYNSKHEKSAESIFKNLLEIVQKMGDHFYPDGYYCNQCGNVFTLSSNLKGCKKCIFYTFYRSLFEIHVYAYKDESKRNHIAALELHNLIFIMFQSLKLIIDIVPAASKIINCIYFVDIIYYLGITFELVSPLSCNAGRYEDMFRQIKDFAHKFTNRQHFHESFLLNVLKRFEISRIRKAESHLRRHSTVSLAITKFHLKNPIPSIVFTRDFMVNNTKDFMGHLHRTSNFILNNWKFNYLHLTESNDLSFASASRTVQGNIQLQHILISTISSIIEMKKLNYESFVNFVVGSNQMIDFGKFREIIGQEASVNPVFTSKSIVENVVITRSGNYNDIIKELADVVPPRDFKKLKKCNTAKCIAKVLNDVPEVLIRLDESFGHLSILSEQKLKNPDSSVTELRHHNELAYYISRINDCMNLLEKSLLDLQIDISNCSKFVDRIIEKTNDSALEIDTQSKLEEHTLVKSLRLKQKVKLVGIEILGNIKFEAETHFYVMYREP